MTAAGRRFESWLREHWPLVLFVTVGIAGAVFVVVVSLLQNEAILACRRQGLDAFPRSRAIAEYECVPRVGHGIDTIIVRTP
jgi:hypothetical protein